MKTVQVCAQSPYEVKIEKGLLQSAKEELRSLYPKARFAIVSDTNVAPLYHEKLLSALGEKAPSYIFPAGEEHKNIATFSEILEFLAGERFTRSDVLLALGGGVTGDMAGFAAACYLRGIDFVQLPTTLLAAVDSSVGGKTAVDLHEGKNLAGAFHQPSLVLIDPDTFATLPAKVYREGVSEALKHGVLFDEALFTTLSSGDFQANIEEVVRQNVEYKAAIVKEDETEHGVRQMLNLGHTFAHAIEACSRFSTSHGEAVSIGLCMAARASERMGFAHAGTLERIEGALLNNALPVRCGYSAKELTNAALGDKKRSGGAITLILIEKIGACMPLTLPIDELEEIMRLGAGIK